MSYSLTETGGGGQLLPCPPVSERLKERFHVAESYMNCSAESDADDATMPSPSAGGV